jgi:hypothetical protein
MVQAMRLVGGHYCQRISDCIYPQQLLSAHHLLRVAYRLVIGWPPFLM